MDCFLLLRYLVLSLPPPRSRPPIPRNPLFDLLLWSQLVRVAALLLATVGCSRWQTGVALSANHFLAVVFRGQGFEGGLDDAASKSEDEVEG